MRLREDLATATVDYREPIIGLMSSAPKKYVGIVGNVDYVYVSTICDLTKARAKNFK